MEVNQLTLITESKEIPRHNQEIVVVLSIFMASFGKVKMLTQYPQVDRGLFGALRCHAASVFVNCII